MNSKNGKRKNKPLRFGVLLHILFVVVICNGCPHLQILVNSVPLAAPPFDYGMEKLVAPIDGIIYTINDVTAVKLVIEHHRVTFVEVARFVDWPM